MKTNFTAGMDECPTLPKLMNFGEDHVDIIKEIGATYQKFGILLLEDGHGSTMGALEGEKRGNAEDINNAVLTRWIRGEGRKPTSWATLATVLEECQLSLADVIRSGKLAQATDRQARNKRKQEGQKLTMTTICTITALEEERRKREEAQKDKQILGNDIHQDKEEKGEKLKELEKQLEEERDANEKIKRELAQAKGRQRVERGQRLTMTTICTIMVFLSAILAGLLLYSMGITQ